MSEENVFDTLGKRLFYCIYKDVTTNIDFIEEHSDDIHSRKLDSITTKIVRNMNKISIKSLINYLFLSSKYYREWLLDSLDQIETLNKELSELRNNYDRRGELLSEYATRAEEEEAISKMSDKDREDYLNGCKIKAVRMVTQAMNKRYGWR